MTTLTVFTFSAYKLLDYRYEAKLSSKLNELMIEKAVSVTYESTVEARIDDVGEKSTRSADTVKRQLETAPISVDFDALRSENDDVVGWLYCPDTPINYPVAQSDDNSYYLRRLLNGEWNASGTLFADYRNDLISPDQNTIIYGHNMKNDSMLGTLPYYSDQAYYESHPVMYFLTPDTDYKIELIFGSVTSSDSVLYDIDLSADEKMSLLADLFDSSDFVSHTEITEDARLLTLSTCSYEYESARYVVVGVMIELAKNN